MKLKKYSLKKGIVCSSLLVALFFNTTTMSAKTGSKQHIETTCIAETIYREARGEPYKGKLAVGQVVLNRTKHKDYPSSVCEVVFQKHQFEWTKGFKTFKAPLSYYKLAEQIRDGNHDLKHFKATHFHANYVHPKWGKKLKHIATIGNHIFYST